MIFTAENLRRYFEELYGYRWVEEAARAIGCTPQTIRNWTKGRTAPPTRYFGRIRSLVDARMAELSKWKDAA